MSAFAFRGVFGTRGLLYASSLGTKFLALAGLPNSQNVLAGATSLEFRVLVADKAIPKTYAFSVPGSLALRTPMLPLHLSSLLDETISLYWHLDDWPSMSLGFEVLEFLMSSTWESVAQALRR